MEGGGGRKVAWRVEGENFPVGGPSVGGRTPPEVPGDEGWIGGVRWPRSGGVTGLEDERERAGEWRDGMVR